MQRATRLMLNIQGKRIHLAVGPTDGRKQIIGLATLVKNSFELDPFESAIFVFCNRSRNRLKILEWDGTGFWLHLKKLEHGRFQWPAAGNEKTMNLTDDEFYNLLAGPGLTQKLNRIEHGRAIA